MLEKDFRAKLVKVFNDRKPGDKHRFIWTFDAHFKAGFPDVYWKSLKHPKSHHVELKLVKEPEVPMNLWSLCTKIQQHVAGQLLNSGADVWIFVMHVPYKNAAPKFIVEKLYGDRLRFDFADNFWAWWHQETR